MIIFVDPDELDSLSHLNPIGCPGLEALTGADFLLSSMPILPTSNIKWHIENDSILVNIKRGYDLVVNHDSPKNFAARMQKLGVKPGRCWLLGIGYYQNIGGVLKVSKLLEDGKLREYKRDKEEKPILFETFLQTIVNSKFRGLEWLNLPSDSHLGFLVKCIEKRPLAPNVVLSKPSYDWHEDDFWQEVEEPQPSDIRRVLSCGLPGFGPVMAQALYQYLIDNKLPLNLFNALVVLSAVNEKGKKQFKVPKFGTESYRQLRQILFSLDEDHQSTANLSLDGGDFQMGAEAALNQFHLLFQEKLKAGVALKVAYEESINLVKKTIGELIPF